MIATGLIEALRNIRPGLTFCGSGSRSRPEVAERPPGAGESPVSGREYRVVDSFADVQAFILTRLSEIGVRPGLVDRIRLVFVRGPGS